MDSIYKYNLDDFKFAALGGFLMSVSSSFHLLTRKRVTGMSGIFNGIVF